MKDVCKKVPMKARKQQIKEWLKFVTDEKEVEKVWRYIWKVAK